MRRGPVACAVAACLAAASAQALELKLTRTLAGPASPAVPPTASPAASADEPTQPLIVALTINSVPRGEKFVHVTAGGALFVRAADLEGLVALPPGVPGRDIEGERHVLPAAIPGARVRLDEKTLVAEVSFPPELLPRQAFDLTRRPAPAEALPAARSALLNYRLGYFGTRGGGRGVVSLATEAAIAFDGWLLRNQSTHASSPDGSTGVRLETQLVRDDRANLRRWIVGDAFLPGLPLGSGAPIAGLTFAKAYNLDPFVSRQPGAGFRGTAEFPSQVDFYVGNTLVLRQRIEPGPFEISNFNYYGGRQDVRVVVRDIFGRERTVEYPFYFAPQGLAAGLHDYSYQVGALREGFGSRSAEYSRPAFSAFHRYGVDDRLTVGLRAEGTSRQFNAGPEVVLRSERFGVLAAGAAASRDSDADGHAWFLSHAFQLREFSSQLTLQRHSPGYVPVYADIAPLLPRSDYNAVVGYASPGLGSVNVGFARRESAFDPLSRSVSLSYSRPVGGLGSVLATWRRELGERGGYDLFVGLQFLLDGKHAVNASHSRDLLGGRTESLQVSRETPRGTGVAYSLNLQRREDEQGTQRTVNPRLEWHSRYGTVSGEAISVSGSGAGSTTAYNVALAGAIVAAGGHVAASRSIADSFAVVQLTPPLAGVRVYENSQEVGRTDDAGRVLLPNVASYSSNFASINDKDVPIEFSIDRVGATFSPSFRSGSVVEFKVAKVQGFTGRLRWRAGGEDRPLEYHLVTLSAGGKAIEIPTAGGGDFYLENLPAGRHRARVVIEGKPCEFDLVVPESADALVPLGDVFTCAR
jgi:outer membrane usher protein